MPFNFPNSPTIGQQATNPTSSIVYTWNGQYWVTTPVTASSAISASFAVSTLSVVSSSYAVSASRLIILDPKPASGSLIASGSGLTYNTSTSTFIVDTVEGIANDNVAFVTPWNFSLKMDSAGQQFYISVDTTGVTRYNWGTRIANYNLVNASLGSSGPAYTFWVTPTAGTWYSWWRDGTLNMTVHGDTETGIFRAATSQTNFSIGLYEEYQITMVLGNLYNNNYFRVTKTK